VFWRRDSAAALLMNRVAKGITTPKTSFTGQTTSRWLRKYHLLRWRFSPQVSDLEARFSSAAEDARTQREKVWLHFNLPLLKLTEVTLLL